MNLLCIRYQDLVSLIDFMYHGEVAIPTEDVSVFLALAEQFKVHTTHGIGYFLAVP
jgi:hypothetical protein